MKNYNKYGEENFEFELIKACKGLSGNSIAISNTYNALCNTAIFFHKTIFYSILHFNLMKNSPNYYLVLTHNYDNYSPFFSFN